MEICLYEGYIRNRAALCEELGISPAASREETERVILLHGYRRWGMAVVEHIYGSFAFVLKDEERGEIICALDPFGIQRLYYCLTEDGQFLVATRLEAIVKSHGGEATPSGSLFRCSNTHGLAGPSGRGGFVREIDPEALQHYMIFGYPVGEKTLYKGVKRLRPGHALIYRDGQCHLQAYFKPAFCTGEDCSEEEWSRRINETLSTILAEDRANFPDETCTSFLSGGVDSSYLLAESGVKNACCIGYDEKQYSEAETASATAARLGAQFKELHLSPDDYFAAIPGFVKSVELPLADPACAAFAIGCRRLSAHTGISMSGEGADEFFAGYHIHRRMEDFVPSKGKRYYGCSGVMEQKAAAKLLKQERLYPYDTLVDEIYEDAEESDPLSLMMRIDISLWLEGDILFGVRSASAANRLPILLPFADRRMFELSARIPSSLKIKDGWGKYILRRAAESCLPHEIAFRDKVGFSVPVRKWIAEESRRDAVERILFGESSQAFYDQTLLRRHWEACIADSRVDFAVVWAAYIFLVWYDTVFKGEG